MKRKYLFAVLSLIAACFVLAACGSSGEKPSGGKTPTDTPTKTTAEFLTEWATETEAVCDYNTSYPVDASILVAPDGTEFIPLVKVKDSENKAVAVIANAFEVTDRKGYKVTYTVADGTVSYTKTVVLTVNIPDPSVFFLKHTDIYEGVKAKMPEMVVLDADGEKIENFTYKLFTPTGEEIAVTDGRFTPASAGNYKVEIYATGINGKAATIEKPLTVREITLGAEVVLADSDVDNGWFSAEGKEFVTNIYGQKAVQSNNAQEFAISLDLGMSLEKLKEKFDYIEFFLSYWGNEAQTYLRSVAGSENIPVYHYERHDQPQLIFWQSNRFEIDTATFDGNIYVQSVWSDKNDWQIAMMKATGKSYKTIKVAAHADEIVASEPFTAPKADYYISTEKQNDEVTVSAKLNGETVTLSENMTFDDTGTLVLTYEANGITETVNIAVIGRYVIHVAEYEREVLKNRMVNAPEAYVYDNVAGENAAGRTVNVSAKFNGEAVNISSGYTPTEEGTLVMTYVSENCDDLSVTVSIVNALKTVIKAAPDPDVWQGVTNATVKGAGEVTVDSYKFNEPCVYSAANNGNVRISFAIGDYSAYDYIEFTIYAVNYVRFQMGTVVSSGSGSLGALYEDTYVHWQEYVLKVPVSEFGELTAARKWGDLPMAFSIRKIVGVDEGLEKKAYALNKNLLYQDDAIANTGTYPQDLENELNVFVKYHTGCNVSTEYRQENWITPGIIVTPTATSGSITIKLNALNENISAIDYTKATIVIHPCWLNTAETFTIGGVTKTTETGSANSYSFEWDCSEWGDEITVSFTAPENVAFSIVSITLSND